MKLQTIIIHFSAILMLTACDKGPRCWGENKNKGIIDSSVEIPCQPIGEKTEHVITSDSMYKALFTDPQSSTGCSLPGIDFNSYTLIGQETRSTGCEAKFIQDVQQDESAKKYVYKVTVKECGVCKPLRISHHWVTVPKLPQGWTVEFQQKVK